MKAILKLEFDDKKGIECDRCMLSTSKNGKEICSALDIRPNCPEEGRRKKLSFSVGGRVIHNTKNG